MILRRSGHRRVANRNQEEVPVNAKKEGFVIKESRDNLGANQAAPILQIAPLLIPMI